MRPQAPSKHKMENIKPGTNDCRPCRTPLRSHPIFAIFCYEKMGEPVMSERTAMRRINAWLNECSASDRALQEEPESARARLPLHHLSTPGLPSMSFNTPPSSGGSSMPPPPKRARVER